MGYHRSTTLLCQQRSIWSRLWLLQWSCMDVRVGLWRNLSAEKLMLLNYGVGENSWESLGLQGDPTSPSSRRSVLSVHWKDWCWSWNSSTLATSCEELIHWKRPWCWEGLGAGGEGDDRRWDGWMASLTRWAWVWVDSRSWQWTGRPGVLQFMGSQRVGCSWVTELSWTTGLSCTVLNTFLCSIHIPLLDSSWFMYVYIFYFFYALHSLWDLSCPTKNWTHACIGGVES